MDLRALSMMMVFLFTSPSFAETCRPKLLSVSSSKSMDETKNQRTSQLLQALLSYQQDVAKAMPVNGVEGAPLVNRLRGELNELELFVQKYKTDSVSQFDERAFIRALAQDYQAVERLIARIGITPSSATRVTLSTLKLSVCDWSAPPEPTVSAAQ